MIRSKLIIIVLILFGLLGCVPYTSKFPLTKNEKIEINKNFIGEWDVKSDLGIFKIFIEPIDNYNSIGTYYRLYEKNNCLTNINTGFGYVSKINNAEYLSVQIALGDTSVRKKYVFFKYEILSKDTLKLSYLSGLKFNKTFKTENAFRNFVKMNQDSFDLAFEPIGNATRHVYGKDEMPQTFLVQSLDFMSPILFPDDVKRGYSSNKDNIVKAKNYFTSIMPDSFEIYIEYKDYKKVDFWVFKKNKDERETILQVWDTDINSNKIQEAISLLNWKNYELIILREKLYAANCISISNENEFIQVGFQRSGMGKYNFDLFHKPIVNEKFETYNDSCQYIMIDSLTVIDYGGPAFGSQCMPKQSEK